MAKLIAMSLSFRLFISDFLCENPPRSPLVKGGGKRVVCGRYMLLAFVGNLLEVMGGCGCRVDEPTYGIVMCSRGLDSVC